mgnify:CR=1 FL=1
MENHSDAVADVVFSVDFLNAAGDLLQNELHSLRGVRPGSRTAWTVSYQGTFSDYAEGCVAKLEHLLER